MEKCRNAWILDPKESIPFINWQLSDYTEQLWIADLSSESQYESETSSDHREVFPDNT